MGESYWRISSILHRPKTISCKWPGGAPCAYVGKEMPLLGSDMIHVEATPSKHAASYCKAFDICNSRNR